MRDKMGIVAWLACGLCIGFVKGLGTYLTASDSWVLSYILTPTSDCSTTESQTPHNLEDLSAAVIAYKKNKPYCVIDLEVVAESNVPYLGIVYDSNSNRAPVVAVGQSTAKKIFGIPEVAPDNIWTVNVNHTDIKNHRDTNVTQFVILEGLEKSEATATNPANLTSWTLLPHLNYLDGAIVVLPKGVRGAFKIAGVCPKEPCFNGASKMTLKFYTELQKESTFLAAKNDWQVEYSVSSQCNGHQTMLTHCLSVSSFAEVRLCVEKYPNCTVDVTAHLTQDTVFSGLVYDSSNSTTPGTAISKEVFSKFLPLLVPTVHWKLQKVDFSGWDQSKKGNNFACLRGNGLAYKKAIGPTLPTKTSPLVFNDWIKEPFPFELKLPSTYPAIGSYSARSLGIQFGTDSDVSFVVQQNPGHICDWRQMGSLVTLTYAARIAPVFGSTIIGS